MNRKGKFMKEKSISFGQGKGSLAHNNREFIADNVDRNRMNNNVTFIRQPIAEAYEMLFGEATARYNAKQKRNDRKIKGSYYEHLFGCKPCSTVKVNALDQKSFYENVVQIGKREDSGAGTEDAELVAECLKEYMADFQKRNPNFYVFNAVLHMDEATPHLHIDYIPVGHYKRGQDTQNGIAQALKEMGFGEGKNAIARWRESEVKVLKKICLEHDIQPTIPEKSRGTLEVAEYKEQRRQADELAEQNKQAKTDLDETRSALEKAAQKKVKLDNIDKLETGTTMFGGKVTVSKEDWENVTALAKREVASIKQNKKLKKERDEAVQKYEDLKGKYDTTAAELSAYKKKAADKSHFSREKLQTDAVRISREEQLSRELQKAKSFISACGLADDFARYKSNKSRNREIE